ncbi:hypothetical protein M758_1G133400 [Ceratodon purpureus]|uniref:Uncharacterized protein n=1 Tax=Ceratodon purpureus TaxID=3225 RepID=A0A8T0J7K0_CERPU|nr:hypothetical protein KC19_1G138500 [Ceratodon purpureus]KAG0629827.1 hypothetical protein M758_1G133400 [Ceratodon purpureus]
MSAHRLFWLVISSVSSLICKRFTRVCSFESRNPRINFKAIFKRLELVETI